ncbi:hypothetical protein AB1Y20_021855 [Prymnesium parvum]|uniref:Coiled-coil domain-containing protein 6 n=1 Tax=Prymnesium parvum TaxID=97485 RepID=A0AB34JMP1_PRYPA|mmetsp:Transcript_9210/g.20542  ORF Transcript_9210/g.20542 Transcript_9210/m.20542 type:complete len:355 (+) Transcript_9210:41-1105(+)
MASEEEVLRLRKELERERHRSSQLEEKLKRQVKAQELMSLQAEQEEEAIANRLMKRLEVLKHEKEELARQVEVEEEMISNALTKKLLKVKEEKVNLEIQLEQEQEYIVNKLQKQLSTVLEEKRALETRLRENTGAVLQSIQQHLAQWRVRSNSGAEEVAAPPPITQPEPRRSGDASPADAQLRRGVPEAADAEAVEAEEVKRTHLLVKHLTQEIDRLGEQQESYRRECEAQRQVNEQLRQELQRLQLDNAGLSHRVLREREIREMAIGEKARLETELELDSERAFNISSASGTSLLTSARSSATTSPALNPFSPSGLISPRPLSEAYSMHRPVVGSMCMPHEPSSSPLNSPRGG